MATNEELQQQLDEMRAEMAALRRQLQQPVAEGPRLLSRRNLLRAAPVAAVGGAVAALSAGPAAAATGDPLLLGRVNSASGNDETRIETPLFVDGDFWFSRVTSTGFSVNAATIPAVVIQSLAGQTSLEVTGGYIDESPSSAQAIHALAAGNVAINAEASDTAVRFSTATDFGTAISATCEGGAAITATSTSSVTDNDAVTIDYAGRSRALYAQSHNPTNINGTVTGVNEGHGIGVWGEQRNNTGPGIGVVGVGGSQGRGSQFTGGVAQTRLVPSTASTHPTTGKAGDLFVDKSVRLWFCTKASSGSTAATWKQIA